MKDSTKYIIMGVGAGLIGTIAYGVGYCRGGQYAIEECEKSFEQIMEDAHKEALRHLDEMSNIYKDNLTDLQKAIDNQRKEYLELWEFLDEDQKKNFIMSKMK